MARGLIGGGTDYSHQSFEEILADLTKTKESVDASYNNIQNMILTLTASGYWNTNVINMFKGIISYSMTFMQTSSKEIEDIVKESKFEVKDYHCKMLMNIGNVADDINIRIGKIWHNDYELSGYKDYSNKEFKMVEDIYAETRNMAVYLLDMSNISIRFSQFIGKSKVKQEKNNPWISGSFYVFLAIIVIAGLVVVSKTVSWIALPIVLIGGIVLIGVIGLFQLKNDQTIKDDTFWKSLAEVYKTVPIIKFFVRKRS